MTRETKTCGGVAKLNREWAALAADRHPFPVDEALPAGSYGDLLPAIRAAPDAVLWRLLRLHATGDHRAGRVVLQAMLGKVVLLARGDDRHDPDEYLAELWLVIAGYPLGRRPERIAANLALDTLKAVRGRRHRESPMGLGGLERPAPGEPAWRVEDVLVVASSLGLVDEPTCRCLRAVYGRGLRSHEAARELQMSAAMVRYRTSRAVRRLAAHADQLLAAA